MRIHVGWGVQICILEFMFYSKIFGEVPTCFAHIVTLIAGRGPAERPQKRSIAGVIYFHPFKGMWERIRGSVASLSGNVHTLEVIHCICSCLL